MQYETIILELMSRIKVLEEDVARMKETIRVLEEKQSEGSAELHADVNELPAPESASSMRNVAYTKMTEQMMDVCYAYGKKAHQNPNANIADYAAIVAKEVNMNRNSAFMYIHAVKSLLEGRVFKRAISTKALRRYFSAIYRDFGANGLATAIAATKEHIKYRDGYMLPSDSIIALCNEFQNKA